MSARHRANGRRTRSSKRARPEVPKESTDGSASALLSSSSRTSSKKKSRDTAPGIVERGIPVKKKQLFLSYGREPEVKSFVTRLKHDLEKRGFTVWLDIEDIPAGSDWRAAIGNGLCDCMGLIAVITNKYIKSTYCANELYVADTDKKCVFPVIYEDVNYERTKKSRGVRLVINGINWTFFRPNKDEYESSLRKLIQGMRDHGIEPSAVEEVDHVPDNNDEEEDEIEPEDDDESKTEEPITLPRKRAKGSGSKSKKRKIESSNGHPEPPSKTSCKKTSTKNDANSESDDPGSPSGLDREPTDDELEKFVATEIDSFQSLGTMLLVKQVQINMIQQEERSTIVMNKRILALWKQQKTRQPITWRTLIEALRDMKMNRLAGQLTKRFGQ